MQFLTDSQFRTSSEITAEWDKGFTLRLDLTNLGNELVEGIVEFESQFEIIPEQIWGAEIISRKGDTYTLKLDEDRNSLDRQESASVFFNANKISNEVTLPQNIKLGSENILINSAAELTLATVTPDAKTPMQFLLDSQFQTNLDITAEWDAGFTVQLDLTNLGENLTDGIVQFESEFELIPGEIWGAEVIGHEGNTYTLKLDDDRNTIDSQKTSSVFFNANKSGNEVTLPQNIRLGSENILIDSTAELKLVETDTAESAISTVTPDTQTRVTQSLELDTAADNSLAADIDFTLVKDWGSGFQGSIAITNQTGGNIDSWSLEFDFPNEINNIWDAEIEENQNGSYVISNADWNQEIKAGETITFGFTGNDAVTVEPQNFELEGYSFNSPSTSDSIYTHENDALTPELQLNQPYQGRATFFDAANPAGGLGNSGYDIPAADRLQQVVAINNIQWNGSEASGAFFQVSGPKQREGAAPIIVQVNDQLVERADGMDMSAQAFELVADPVAGIVNIDYQLVGPADDYVTAYGHQIGDGIVVEGIADSNPWYPTLRLNNHRYPIESVELIESDGDLVEFERGSDNRFVLDETSAIYGAQDLLVTDIFGQQVTLDNINISNGSSADTVTGEQFSMI